MTSLPSARPLTPQASSRAAAAGATRRLWPWFGVAAFILGYIATWGVQFSVSHDALHAGGPVLVDAIGDGNNEIIWRLTSGLGYVAVGFLVAFAAGLRRDIEARADQPSTIPAVVWSGFLITGAALALAWCFRAMVFDGFADYQSDPSAHTAINRLSQDVGLAAWVTLGISSAAITVAGFRGYVFSRAFAWFSGVMTTFIVLACLSGTAFPGNIPAGIWLAGLSLWAVRQRSA